MESINIVLGLSNIFVSLLVIGISIPLVMEKIPMNEIYGIRFGKSFEANETWYKVDKFGGRQLIIWAIPLFLLGVLSFFIPIEGNTFLIILIACAPLIIVVPAFKSYMYLRTL